MSRTFSRTPQACSFCRRRKTKCDGVRPRCQHCRTKNLACEWSSIGPSEIPTNSNSNGQTLGSSLSSSTTTLSLSSSSPSTASLIDPHGLSLCIQLFFDRHFATDFCSFDHRPDFEQKCRQDSLLASAVVALCGRYLPSRAVRSSLFGQFSTPRGVSRAYTRKARLLAKMASDEPSVAHIQANLILAMAELLSNSGSRHWLFSGIAIRMAEMMRLNKEFHQKHSLKEQEIRRRTFWACLLFDRALAYLLGKHRTIDVDNVSIALPETDSSLAHQDESRGVTLATLSAYRRSSDLGVHPYFVKTVCLWSEMADFANQSRRQVDPYPPTDPRSTYSIRNAGLQTWVRSLPAGLIWSAENYEGQVVLGQAICFVAMHFLLCSASCVALQCYLPHVTLFTKLVDLVDAAGLSYQHRDPQLVASCVSSAFEVGEMLQFFVDRDRLGRVSALSPRTSSSSSSSSSSPHASLFSSSSSFSHSSSSSFPHSPPLQSVWVAASISIVANTFLWLCYADDEICTAPGVRERANHYFHLVQELFSAWGSEWKAARQWLSSLNAMHNLYKAAYLGQLHDGLLRWEEDDNNDEQQQRRRRRTSSSASGGGGGNFNTINVYNNDHEKPNNHSNADEDEDEGDDDNDDSDNNDFHPQPGDGFPSLISLPTLQSSVKFATSDTSAKSISLQFVWLQLSGGWHYGFGSDLLSLADSVDNSVGVGVGVGIVNEPFAHSVLSSTSNIN